MNDRFNFRVAIKQAEGSYKRYKVISLGRDARGLYARCSIPHKENEFYLHNIVIDGENAILEQCTGLKDKKGKEIFEGDVLNCIDTKLIVCFNPRISAFIFVRDFDIEQHNGLERAIPNRKAIEPQGADYLSRNFEIIGKVNEKEGE